MKTPPVALATSAILPIDVITARARSQQNSSAAASPALAASITSACVSGLGFTPMTSNAAHRARVLETHASRDNLVGDVAKFSAQPFRKLPLDVGLRREGLMAALPADYHPPGRYRRSEPTPKPRAGSANSAGAPGSASPFEIDRNSLPVSSGAERAMAMKSFTATSRSTPSRAFTAARSTFQPRLSSSTRARR